MDSRHASLARRTLEEIRQKRAAERLSKTSSGPDLTNIPNEVVGIKRSESTTRLSESDMSGLVSQLKQVQKNNAELDEANRALASKLQTKEAENNMLQKRLNDLHPYSNFFARKTPQVSCPPYSPKHTTRNSPLYGFQHLISFEIHPAAEEILTGCWNDPFDPKDIENEMPKVTKNLKISIMSQYPAETYHFVRNFGSPIDPPRPL
ncbi:hypothetical protein A4A49_17939 [Nicotiana attenuata]|uniref:Uncharacterized protein n=1 Tax=Nicotiana attenuata TaxID=49451 RepID=A0A314KN51_NICAT|nr:hypothetical protein A4A49_17939 [Nicotiana attenuata]